LIISEIKDILKYIPDQEEAAVYQDIHYYDPPKLKEDNEEYSNVVWHYDDSLFVGTSSGTVVHVMVQFEEEGDRTIVKFFEKARITCLGKITNLLISQLHLIVTTTENILEFFEKNEQGGLKGDTTTKEIPFKSGEIGKIFFSQDMLEMYISNENGQLFLLPQPAEKMLDEDYEDEEVEDNQKREKVVMVQPELILEHSTAAIVFVKVIKKTNFFLSIDANGFIFVYNIETGEKVTKLSLQCTPTTADMNTAGNLVFVGTEMGCIKVIDFEDPTNPRCVMVKKVTKIHAIKKLSISNDDKMLAVIYKEERQVLILSAVPKDRLRFYGYSVMPGTVEDLSWSRLINAPIPEPYKHMVEILVRNGLILAMAIPYDGELMDTLEEFDSEKCALFGRRIDHDMNKIVVNPQTGEIFCTGEQLFFLKYEQPTVYLPNMDKKVKQPDYPAGQIEAHDLCSTCITTSGKHNEFISGAKDGSVLVVNSNTTETTSFFAHGYKSGGVSYCSLNSKNKVILTGGYDGSVYVFFRKGYLIKEKQKIGYGDNAATNLASLKIENDSSIRFYKVILEAEDQLAKAEEKERIQASLRGELLKIKSRLNELLNANKNADDIEKLERDEFCLDLKSREQMLSKAVDDVQSIIENARFQNLRQELLHSKIMQNTYSKLKANLKTITGLEENTLITNFPLLKPQPDKLEKLRMLKNLRFMEIKEKEWRKSKKRPEYISLESLSKKPIKYIVNPVSGKQEIILLDHEKREEERQQTKLQAQLDTELGGRANNDNENEQDMPPLTGYRLKRKERVQRKQKKRMGVQMNQNEDDGRGIEWEFKDEEEGGLTHWDYLYGALELFTRKRKQTQVHLLREIIIAIKSRFNKEFDIYLKMRNDRIEQIQEKNNQIKEVMEDLDEDVEMGEYLSNIIENPEKVLTVEDGEVPFQKYVTKAERAETEKKRLEEELRLKKLQQDDAGIRALKQMMNNTLEEKKDNNDVQELVEEDWMKLDPKNMSNEQRQKLEDFEAKKAQLLDERTKIIKKRKQDLKKLQKKIEEIKKTFDRKLFVLFTKRMEYQYRVYEQQMYVIKLKQSLLGENRNYEDLHVVDLQIKLITKKKQQYELFKLQLERLQIKTQEEHKLCENDEKQTAWSGLKDKWKALLSHYQEDQLQPIEKQYSKEHHRQFLTNNPHLERRLNELDAYYDIEEGILRRMGSFDVHSYENDPKIKNLMNPILDSGKQKLTIEGMESSLVKARRTNEKDRLRKLIDKFIDYNQKDIRGCIIHLEKVNRDRNEKEEDIRKAYANIYIQMRFKKEFVEISLNQIVDLLKDAILIKMEIIGKKNGEIKDLGDKKVEALEANLHQRYEVDNSRYEVQTKDLEIEDLIIESMAITRLKVTKQLQAALDKNNNHMAEVQFY